MAKTRHWLPSSDKEGEPGPQVPVGVVRTEPEKSNQELNCNDSHHPSGAARHIPSSTEEGSLVAILQFRDRNQAGPEVGV